MTGVEADLELAGWWWLPHQPGDKVPGVLRCVRGERPRLSLIGGFDPRVVTQTGPNSWASTGESRTLAAVLGAADGNPVTLLDCHSEHYSVPMFGPPTEQTLGAMSALVGIHLDAPDEAAFKAIEVEIEDLLAWSDVSGIEERIEFQNGQRIPRPGSLSADFPEERTVRVHDFRVTLQHGFRTGTDDSRSERTARITEHAWLAVEPDTLQSAADLAAYTKPLQDLITLSTYRPAAVISQVLVAPAPPVDEERSEDGPPAWDRKVRLYTKYVVDAEPQAEAARFPDLLFTMSDIAFEQVVPAWFEVEQRLASACNMVFGLHYVGAGYLESRVMTAVSAAEALHRRLTFAPPMDAGEFDALRDAVAGAAPDARRQWVRERFWNEPSLKERLLDLASVPDRKAVDTLIPDRERWATLAKRARNDLAHRGESDGAVSIDEMYAVVEATRALLTLVLLAETGVQPSVQQRIVRDSRRLQQVGREARTHLTRRRPSGT